MEYSRKMNEAQRIRRHRADGFAMAVTVERRIVADTLVCFARPPDLVYK
jgi:hypothetical protein